MMIIAIVPVVVLVLGLLLWALASNPLVKTAGERMFTCGLLVTLFVVARFSIKLP